jgi:hypothetical protein
MFPIFEIYTLDDFAEYIGCVLAVAVVVLPIAAVLWFVGKNIVKLLILWLDTAYGCMVELKHNNNKRKKGK